MPSRALARWVRDGAGCRPRCDRCFLVYAQKGCRHKARISSPALCVRWAPRLGSRHSFLPEWPDLCLLTRRSPPAAAECRCITSSLAIRSSPPPLRPRDPIATTPSFPLISPLPFPFLLNHTCDPPCHARTQPAREYDGGRYSAVLVAGRQPVAAASFNVWGREAQLCMLATATAARRKGHGAALVADVEVCVGGGGGVYVCSPVPEEGYGYTPKQSKTPNQNVEQGGGGGGLGCHLRSD